MSGSQAGGRSGPVAQDGGTRADQLRAEFTDIDCFDVSFRTRKACGRNPLSGWDTSALARVNSRLHPEGGCNGDCGERPSDRPLSAP